MIRLKIKVSNDHSALTEHFECEDLLLSLDSTELQEMAQKVIKAFNAPVEEVKVTASMDL